MQDLHENLMALKLGGAMIIPLSFLAIIAFAIMLEKAVLYWRYARLSKDLLTLIETYGFAWDAVEKESESLNENNYFRRFFNCHNQQS